MKVWLLAARVCFMEYVERKHSRRLAPSKSPPTWADILQVAFIDCEDLEEPWMRRNRSSFRISWKLPVCSHQLSCQGIRPTRQHPWEPEASILQLLKTQISWPLKTGMDQKLGVAWNLDIRSGWHNPFSTARSIIHNLGGRFLRCLDFGLQSLPFSSSEVLSMLVAPWMLKGEGSRSTRSRSQGGRRSCWGNLGTFSPKDSEGKEQEVCLVCRMLQQITTDKRQGRLHENNQERDHGPLENNQSKGLWKLVRYPILGDGKGDNQNTAVHFTRGTFVQCIDANQAQIQPGCRKIAYIAYYRGQNHGKSMFFVSSCFLLTCVVWGGKCHRSPKKKVLENHCSFREPTLSRCCCYHASWESFEQSIRVTEAWSRATPEGITEGLRFLLTGLSRVSVGFITTIHTHTSHSQPSHWYHSLISLTLFSLTLNRQRLLWSVLRSPRVSSRPTFQQEKHV